MSELWHFSFFSIWESLFLAIPRRLIRSNPSSNTKVTWKYLNKLLLLVGQKLSTYFRNICCVHWSLFGFHFFFSPQIKVAVSADRDCIRAYQPQISSTNYNTLTLNVKTAEPDNLLFYLGSNGKVSFWCTFIGGDINQIL